MMCDPKEKEQKERAWGDQEPQEEQDDAYEPTYRDGSAVNECWAQDKDSV